MFKNKEEQFDFYWKEIFTGLAYNPIEFNTYRFDQTMSLPGKVNKLYDMLKVLAMNNQEVMDYLKEFVETFDEKLYETIEDVLTVWLEDGRLADVVRVAISEEVIEARTDYLGKKYDNLKERLDEERKEVIDSRGEASTLNDRLVEDKADVISQLTHIEEQVSLNPDKFEGTDLEKLQQAYDYAIEHLEHTIYLNRTYDITGGTIWLPDGNLNFFEYYITFVGGKIKKEDAGFIFDSKGEGNLRLSPKFINTKFHGAWDSRNGGGTYVYNGDKMIRQNAVNCMFMYIGFVKTTNYLQSTVLINPLTGELGCHFIEAPLVYDLEIIRPSFEQNLSPFQVLKISPSSSSTTPSIYGLRIEGGVIEGYKNTHPIELGGGYGIKIDGTYFEGNMESIRIKVGNSNPELVMSMRNVQFFHNLGTYDLNIDSRVLTEGIQIEDSFSRAENGKYFTNIPIDGIKNTKSRSSSVYEVDGKNSRPHFPEQAVTTLNERSLKHTIKYSETGVEVQIPLNIPLFGSIYDLENTQFMVNFKGVFGNKRLTSHLMGVLSIDFHENTQGEMIGELLLSELSERNTRGIADGNLENPSSYTYFFKETNSKGITVNATKATMVVKFDHLNDVSVMVKGFNDMNQTFKNVEDKEKIVATVYTATGETVQSSYIIYKMPLQTYRDTSISQNTLYSVYKENDPTKATTLLLGNRVVETIPHRYQRNYYGSHLPIVPSGGLVDYSTNPNDVNNGIKFTGVAGNTGKIRIHNALKEVGLWTLSGRVRSPQNARASFLVNIQGKLNTQVHTRTDGGYTDFYVSLNVSDVSESVNFIEFQNIQHAVFLVEDLKLFKGDKKIGSLSKAPEEVGLIVANGVVS